MASGSDTEIENTVADRQRRQLELAQQITHVGSWEWELATGTVTWSDELYRIYGLAPGTQAVTFEWFLGRVHPDDRDRVQREIAGALERGGRFAHDERIVRPDGSIRELESAGEVTVDAAGQPTGVIGTCRDVTDDRLHQKLARRAQRLQAEERRALELLAAGAPLAEILTVLVHLIEELAPSTIASILLLDASGTRLRHGSAPSLPAAFNAALVGIEIGPRVGSCGTAVYRRAPVFVTDIEQDPLWAEYRELAATHGLRACWSSPILSTDGRVLGTFALYYREPRAPDDTALELISRAAHIAGIAIERRELDDLMHALSSRIEAIREDERTGIAREVHDVLGQALTAMKLDLAWLTRRLTNGDAITAKLAEMSHTTDGLIHAVQRISAELRPGILDDVGLAAAIEWQAEEFTRRTGIPCSVQSDLGDIQVARELATAMFRIFQEALTNVARHAGATQVTVSLRLERGQLKLDVVDDGVGLPATASRGEGSLGLLGMRERARRLDGTCVIDRGWPTGTTVAVSIPLRFPADGRPDDREP